ncbi:hypothetical protein PCANC_00271 [Puccinia coronata f. sp. avenae]|uniref:Uncharacterized protein n=1 Tax=Puccinia coronata f. sp. avenae TaxID=200324 RepID=A0A2N5W9C4_9BASI|nr:hypothetical protein PCANC_00271 [Puccinia coronata f. sp. avenae]
MAKGDTKVSNDKLVLLVHNKLTLFHQCSCNNNNNHNRQTGNGSSNTNKSSTPTSTPNAKWCYRCKANTHNTNDCGSPSTKSTTVPTLHARSSQQKVYVSVGEKSTWAVVVMYWFLFPVALPSNPFVSIDGGKYRHLSNLATFPMFLYHRLCVLLPPCNPI